MYKIGHYGAALLCYAPVGVVVSLVFGSEIAVFLGVGTVALCRIPDYDLRIPFVSHRGVTHTLLFLLVVTAALAVGGLFVADVLGTDPLSTAGLGAVVGVVAIGSHLAADVITPAGIPLLWPLSDRSYSLGVVTASNTIANYGLLLSGTAAVAVAFVILG
ncbi:MAG: metal-dependent hydrolase [Natronomonas sp.]